jgi:deoxyribonuclease-4
MAILGAHQSIAGGYYKAVERAHALGCDCVQLFTHSASQWRSKPITAEEAARFRAALSDSGIRYPLAHDSYLINLASPQDELWRKSLDAMVQELLRAETLGIPYVVAHPGAYTSGSEAAGLARIIEALDEIDRQTSTATVGCLLETTAGAGTSIGWRFEQLAAILAGVRNPDRLGVCFDTCHVFAAGYPLATPRGYRKTMREFDRVIGLGRIRAFHLNDSRGQQGSRIDRHAHIGRGRIGLDGFRALLGDRRFRASPMVLETPKETRGKRDADAVNLRLLRRLVKEEARD